MAFLANLTKRKKSPEQVFFTLAPLRYTSVFVTYMVACTPKSVKSLLLLSVLPQLVKLALACLHDLPLPEEASVGNAVEGTKGGPLFTEERGTAQVG